MSRLQAAIDQLVFARNYALGLLESIDPADWFRMPTEGGSHIAWQVGHLATAEYHLALDRQRGRRPEDAVFISDSFRQLFGRESVPDPDPAKYPSAAEIREVFNRVHAQVMLEIPTYSDADLDSISEKPHRLCKTKIEFLRWVSAHELMHAGQIGLLRRLLGKKPIW